MASVNPFDATILRELTVDGVSGKYYSLPDLKDERVARLPFCIRVLLEAALRNCDGRTVTTENVEAILNWEETSNLDVEIPFKPARVVMQDFTGVPAVVDLAAMRDAVVRLGGSANQINPLVPVDLVIDHSVQADVTRSADAVAQNQEREFTRNFERFRFLKWGSQVFENLQIVPPGAGIVHQVNLEYLARVVFSSNGVLYPDSLVGTDSHTTMINGLGIVGWGVGGIEAEASMLGQPISMVLPKVVGYRLTGHLGSSATSTDLVLTIVENLRAHKVVGKFVEFFGDGVHQLSLADRATISNMCPEYGATIGYFPVDEQALTYMRQTGRSEEQVSLVESYLRAQEMFRVYQGSQTEPVYSELLELDLSTVEPSLAGPKRPHDRVPLSQMKTDFQSCLGNRLGFKGFGIAPSEHSKEVRFTFEGEEFKLSHGDVVIAAITSCTNTSNPSVMLGAGLLAKKAVEAGLQKTRPYIKTSLSPGSGVVTEYLAHSGVQPYLDQLGFSLTGYGCMTCIGNSGELPESVATAIQEGDLVAASVLSGNRNFEARIHPLTRASYLASPPLVVAYALAGSVLIDFETEPLGVGSAGQPVFLRDIWPSQEEIQQCIVENVMPEMFSSAYGKIKNGTERWNSMDAPSSELYEWEESSTYIHNPPFFKTMEEQPEEVQDIVDAYCLLNLGDSVTTDHISPAGNIARNSPAARYLMERGVEPRDFNTYGARRGNDEIMARGTFANVRLTNKLVGQPGPKTLHVPSGEVLDIFDAAMRYQEERQQLIVLAGAEYGSGSSRDWAAKGPFLQGVKAVIAKSYERIHRSNLVGMGIIPLQFKDGEDAESLGLTGQERFSIVLDRNLQPGMEVIVRVDGAKEFSAVARFDTPVELDYYRHGGILQFVLRNLLQQSKASAASS